MTISMHGVGSAESASWPRLPLTFATLMSALRSNNLAAARQAYDDLSRGLQPQVGSLIAPVGTALGAGDLAQAGRMLGQMRGDLAAAAAFPVVALSVAATNGVASAATAPATNLAPFAAAAGAQAVATPGTAYAAPIALDWLV